MHAYAVFFLAFLEEFGWSRAETSVAYAVASVLAAGTRSNGRECVAALALPAVAPRVIEVYERALALQGAH